MKSPVFSRAFLAIISVIVTSALSSSGHAQTVPSGMTYQGRLTDASNAPVPDGTGYEIEVRLWSASTGGTLLWGTRYTGVPLKSGAFNLILGSGGTPIPGATHTDLKLAFNTPTVHLGLTPTKSATGVAIPSPTEILPRQQIFSTPYAFRAETAAAVLQEGVLSAAIKDGEIVAADLATGAVTNEKVQDLSLTGSKLAMGTITPNKMAFEYASFGHELPSSNTAAPSIAGWQTHPLNKDYQSVGSSISRNGNVITLQAGTYFIEGSASSSSTDGHQAILRDLSDDSTALRGTNAGSDSRYNGTSESVFRGYVTVSSGAKSYDIYHFTRLAHAYGLGFPLVFSSGQRSEPGVFATITILRLK